MKASEILEALKAEFGHEVTEGDLANSNTCGHFDRTIFHLGGIGWKRNDILGVFVFPAEDGYLVAPYESIDISICDWEAIQLNDALIVTSPTDEYWAHTLSAINCQLERQQKALEEMNAWDKARSRRTCRERKPHWGQRSLM
jgi:hypothetical protein